MLPQQNISPSSVASDSPEATLPADESGIAYLPPQLASSTAPDVPEATPPANEITIAYLPPQLSEEEKRWQKERIAAAKFVPESSPIYRPLVSKTDFISALYIIVSLCKQELRIFAPDWEDIPFESADLQQHLREYLLQSPAVKLTIILHRTHKIPSHSPRLMLLLRFHAHQMQIRRTHEAISHIEDMLIISDTQHTLRRPHHQQNNGSLRLHDLDQTSGWLIRFDEIEQQSQIAISPTATGL